MYMMRPEEVESLPLETRGSSNRLSLRVRTNCYVLIELMKVLKETFPSTEYASPQTMGKRAELTSAQLTSRNLKASRTKQRGRRREETLYICIPTSWPCRVVPVEVARSAEMDGPDVQITLQLENGRVVESQEAHIHAGPRRPT